MIISISPASCHIKLWIRGGAMSGADRHGFRLRARVGAWSAVWSGNECNQTVRLAVDPLQMQRGVIFGSLSGCEEQRYAGWQSGPHSSYPPRNSNASGIAQ